MSLVSQCETTHHTFLCVFLGHVVAVECAIHDYSKEDKDVSAAAHCCRNSLR